MAAILESRCLIRLVLTLSMFGVTDSQLVNIALNKSTNMSSVLDTYGSYLAVDGNTSNAMCSQSDVSGGSDTWWWVDLTQDRVVRYITLYLNPGSANTMNGSEVYVSGVSGVPEDGLEPCHTVTSTGGGADVPDVVNITCDSTGRFVFILKRGNQNNNSTFWRLELCEVQVYVCLSGSYGSNCSNSCGKCSVGECDPVSGVCRGGCRGGYTGDHCNTVCGSGQYGQGCSLTCGQCGGDGCHHVTGWCQGGCKDGYTGNTCNKTLVSETDASTMSPVVAGVIGGVITLAIIMLLIVVCCLIYYFCVARDWKVPMPTSGRSTVSYTPSKSDRQTGRNTAQEEDIEERMPHYEQLDEPRYTPTQPVSRDGSYIRPIIIVTPDATEHAAYENSETAPRDSDPEPDYMAMDQASQAVYEPMELGVVDLDMIAVSDQHGLDKNLGGNAYLSMKDFVQEEESTSM